MKITLETTAGQQTATLPYDGAPHVEADGSCPACGHADGPLKLIGKASAQVIDYDTITAPALALCCGAEIGRLVVQVNTIFGIEEDRAVLCGRPRVY